MFLYATRWRCMDPLCFNIQFEESHIVMLKTRASFSETLLRSIKQRKDIDFKRILQYCQRERARTHKWGFVLGGVFVNGLLNSGVVGQNDPYLVKVVTLQPLLSIDADGVIPLFKPCTCAVHTCRREMSDS